LPLKLRKYKFDIVHDLSQIGPFLFNLPFKRISTIHDLSAILFPETFDVFSVLLQKYVLPMTLKNVDVVITISENTKKDIVKYLKYPKEKIKRIYLGVDERFKPLEKTDNVLNKYNIISPYILYVGTLQPRKNITLFIKAFYKLKRNGIEHKLVVAGGKGWKYKEIYKTINKLKLQKEVIFTGYVEDDDLPYLYNAADLFIYPSLYEGFGLPLLEAMACGCPVITSNTSSLPEVVGDAGIMIDPYNVDALVGAMREVLSNDNLRENMIKRGLERAKMFSWEKTARETLKVYKEVMEK
jgi:glycosyltransferase involved in cell wall biosynthesis